MFYLVNVGIDPMCVDQVCMFHDEISPSMRQGLRWKMKEIQRRLGPGELLPCDSQIDAGRADGGVPEQGLDRGQVHAGLKKVCGKGMPQGMDASAFLDAGLFFGCRVDVLDAAATDGGCLPIGREQEFRGAGDQPMPAKFEQEPRGQYRVSILVAFALVNSDHHALAVDVAYFQGGEFANPKTGCISCHEYSPVLRVQGGRKQPFQLLSAQDLRKPFLALPAWDGKRHGWPVQGDCVQEAKGRCRYVTGAPCQLFLLLHIQQVLLGLQFRGLFRRAVEMLCKTLHGIHVRFLCSVRKAANLHVVDHFLAKWCHDGPPLMWVLG